MQSRRLHRVYVRCYLMFLRFTDESGLLCGDLCINATIRRYSGSAVDVNATMLVMVALSHKVTRF